MLLDDLAGEPGRIPGHRDHAPVERDLVAHRPARAIHLRARDGRHVGRARDARGAATVRGARTLRTADLDFARAGGRARLEGTDPHQLPPARLGVEREPELRGGTRGGSDPIGLPGAEDTFAHRCGVGGEARVGLLDQVRDLRLAGGAVEQLKVGEHGVQGVGTADDPRPDPVRPRVKAPRVVGIGHGALPPAEPPPPGLDEVGHGRRPLASD